MENGTLSLPCCRYNAPITLSYTATQTTEQANEVEYPQYFVADFESIDKFEVVTDVLSALHVVSAPDRIDAFVHLSERRGWKVGRWPDWPL